MGISFLINIGSPSVYYTQKKRSNLFSHSFIFILKLFVGRCYSQFLHFFINPFPAFSNFLCNSLLRKVLIVELDYLLNYRILFGFLYGVNFTFSIIFIVVIRNSPSVFIRLDFVLYVITFNLATSKWFIDES